MVLLPVDVTAAVTVISSSQVNATSIRLIAVPSVGAGVSKSHLKGSSCVHPKLSGGILANVTIAITCHRLGNAGLSREADKHH